MFGLFEKPKKNKRKSVKEEFTPPGPEVKTVDFWNRLYKHLESKGMSEEERWKEKIKYMTKRPKNKVYYYYFDLYPIKEQSSTVRIIGGKLKDVKTAQRYIADRLGEKHVVFNQDLERLWRCELRNIYRYSGGGYPSAHETLSAVVLLDINRVGVIYKKYQRVSMNWSSNEWNMGIEEVPVRQLKKN